MEQLNFPVKLFAGFALAAGMLAGCNNNTGSDSTTDSDTATQRTMVVDSNAIMPPADSGAMTPSVTDTGGMKKMQGNAKPNAALKGKKGKVSIIAPAKMSGPMTADASGVYSNVDYIPSFPGGNAGLQKYFDDNLHYPDDASANGVEGTVRIAFTIDENGKLISPMVEGSNEGYGLDEEAVRVIKSMPAWNPGKIKGKPVKTKFVLPVTFKLDQ